MPNSLVGGRITLSVAYNQGLSRITAFTVYVDDAILYSQKASESLPVKGIHYLPLDTSTLTDGNHTIRVLATGTRGRLGEEVLPITVKNGLAGGQDVVPPLVQFRSLLNNQEVSGTIDLDLMAEDNTMQNLFVSIFVNQEVKLLKNVPPYSLRLDTAKYLDPKTGRGEIRLEAWAYDRANNLGKARPITLSVVPAPSLDLTRKQDDPTSKPVMPVARPQEPGTRLEVDLNTRPVQMSEMRIAAPMPLPSEGVGEAVNGLQVKLPGSRVPSAQVAGKSGGALVEPDAVTSGSEARPMTGLGSPKAKLPSAARVMMAKADRTGVQAIAPDFAPTLSKPTLNSGARTVAPDTKIAKAVAPKPSLQVNLPARTEAVGPMGGLTIPAPVPMASPIPMATPRIAEPSTKKPVISASINGEQIAKAGGEGVIVVVPSGAVPDKNGKVPVQVYRPKTVALSQAALPKDREYRIQSGETLETVAKRFKVTAKSIQIANGLTGSRVPAGSIVKVPGAFDVVMNNQRIAFDVSPRIQGGLPLAPFRQIFEHAGGVVVYFPDTREVRAANDTKDVKLKIGSKEASVNQVLVVMEKEASIDGGRTIVPVSFLEKALDLKAEYDVKTGTVILGQK